MNENTKKALFLTLLTWMKATPWLSGIGSADFKHLLELALEDFKVAVIDWTLESLEQEFKQFIHHQGAWTPDQAMTALPMIYHEFRRLLLRDEGITAIRIKHSCGCIVWHPRIGRFGVTVSYVKEENRVCMECFKNSQQEKPPVYASN